MSQFHRNHRAAGFSLIEVMIAVVVLSVGLLALAALQASLIRASAESKAQSVGLSLAKDQLEVARNFRSIDEYRSLTAASGTHGNSAAVGGVSYSWERTVERFAFDGGVFAPVASTGALGVTYSANNEFKLVRVKVTWQDAAGSDRYVTVEDVVSAVDPLDSARMTKLSRGNTPRPAQMIIHDPSLTDGVIPIAIGGGTDTAATNPKPVVAGRNNNERVVETRFDVLTYAALGDTGTATAQSRVETSVVGCTCDTARGGASLPKGRRPTFWDGQKYAVPEIASYSPPAGHAQLGNDDPPESPLCTICCRDHHDNTAGVSRVPNGSPKFSPRRSGPHEHFRTGLTEPVTVGRYVEACRVIRVDGVFRVAADIYDDKFGLLATANDASSPVPSSDAVSGYQAFVLSEMQGRFVNSTSYNARGSYTVPYAHVSDPSNIELQATADFKWLHARGLYVDYLEADAIGHLAGIKAQCSAANCDAETLKRRILSAVPFTTINLSEIAGWSPIAGDDIVVTNNDFLSSITSQTPVRGRVTPGASATDGRTPDATAAIFESNSGLALMLAAINSDEISQSDSQRFTIVGNNTDGGRFTVTLGGGYPFSSSSSAYPEITSVPGALCNFATNGGSKPNPYTCTSSNLGAARTLTVGRYNYQLNTTKKDSITCVDAAGSNPVVWNPSGNEGYTVKVCRNFAVESTIPATAAADRTVLNDGTVSERTSISFGEGAVPDNGEVTITFGSPVDTTQTLTCRYSTTTANNGNTARIYTVSSPNCP